MFDVAVVGLGPGGSSAAYYAAKSGAKVVAFEKRREIGIPIQCGEYLPREHMFKEILPSAKHIDLLVSYPRELIRVKTRGVVLYSPKGKPYRDSFDGYIVDRAGFDKWLASLAVGAGVDLRIESTVYSIRWMDGFYRLYVSSPAGKYEVDSKVVILACGASSPLNEMVGLDKEEDPYNLSPVIQVQMAGADVSEEDIEMYTGNEYCPGAYAWIFPRGDGFANVGLGIRKPYLPKDKGWGIRDYLWHFIRNHPIASEKLRGAKPISIVGGLVPVGPPLKSVGRNVLLVGDAANHVLASVGAGIPTAVIGGSLAGKVSAGYVSGDNELTLYERLWREEFGDALDAGYKIRQAIDVLNRSDKLMEKGLELFGEQHMSDFVRAKLSMSIRFMSWVSSIARTL